MLAAGGVEYPLTHNIAMLVARVAEAGEAAPPDAEALPRVTPFGVAFGYGEMDDPGEVQLDTDWALACVDRTLAWADAIVKGQGAP